MAKTGEAYYASDFRRAESLADSALALTKGVDEVLYAKTLNRKAQVLLKLQEFDEAEKLALLSLQEAEKTDDQEAIGDALNVLGNFYANKVDVSNARVYYERSLALARKINDSLGEGAVLNNLGTCMEVNGYYPEALKYFIDAVEVYEKMDSLRPVGMIYANMAAVYKQQGNYKSAIEFQKRANEISKTTHNTHALIYGSDNLGVYYNAIGEMDTAIHYHHFSLRLADSTGNRKYWFMAYAHLSSSYLLRQEPFIALEYARKAFDLVNTMELPYDKAGIQVKYAKALYETGSTALALSMLNEAKMTADSSNAPDLQLELFDAYANMLEREGDYRSALGYLKQWQAVKDATLDKEKVAAIERENIRFRVNEKDKEIAGQKITNARQQRWVVGLTASVVIVLLLAGLLFFRNQNMKHKSRFLESEKLLLEEMNERLSLDNSDLLRKMEDLKVTATLTQKQIDEIGEQVIVFPTKNRMRVLLKCNEIEYIEQDGDYSWVVPLVKEKKFQMRGTLREMERFLSDFPVFAKVQQSYIVNLDHILECNRSRVKMVSGKDIKLGRDYQDGFMKIYENRKLKPEDARQPDSKGIHQEAKED